MRYGPPNTTGSEGGYVLSPVRDIATSRETIITQIGNLPTENYTPLSETLREAALYFQGGTPKFGAANSDPASMKSARTSRR